MVIFYPGAPLDTSLPPFPVGYAPDINVLFREYTHEITKEMWPGTTHPEWYEYFLAGWRGVLERLSIDIASPKGMNLLVYGTIPPASGVR